MKIENIFQSFTELRGRDIIFYSLLILPIILDPWARFLANFVLKGHPEWMWIALLSVGIAYGFGAMALVFANEKARKDEIARNEQARKREIARDQIRVYLLSHHFKFVSNNRIREHFEQTYTDEFLDSVATSFPLSLRLAFKKVSPKVRGLAIVGNYDDVNANDSDG